jgi:hypothetical protein
MHSHPHHMYKTLKFLSVTINLLATWRFPVFFFQHEPTILALAPSVVCAVAHSHHPTNRPVYLSFTLFRPEFFIPPSFRLSVCVCFFKKRDLSVLFPCLTIFFSPIIRITF